MAHSPQQISPRSVAHLLWLSASEKMDLATINSMHADLEARLIGTLTPFEREIVYEAINELAGLAVARLATEIALGETPGG